MYKCDYTDGNGNAFPAACKKCNPKPEAEDVFKREIETLRKLNHLFVVKYLDVTEKDSKTYLHFTSINKCLNRNWNLTAFLNKVHCDGVMRRICKGLRRKKVGGHS